MSDWDDFDWPDDPLTIAVNGVRHYRATRPAPKVETDELVVLWKIYQRGLAQYGVSWAPWEAA
jgi:hypothetical protein